MFGIILPFPTTGKIVLFLKLKLKLVLINNSPRILQNAKTVSLHCLQFRSEDLCSLPYSCHLSKSFNLARFLFLYL